MSIGDKLPIEDILKRVAESGAVWKLVACGDVQGQLIREVNTLRCPLEVVFNLTAGAATAVADMCIQVSTDDGFLSDPSTFGQIVNAADRTDNAPLRARLLAACGLAEETP